MMLEYRNPPPLFDVGTVWRTVWHRRLLVVLFTLSAVIVTGLYIALAKPSYSATAAILVDPRDLKSTNIDNVLPGIGADSAAITSQVSVIESRDQLAKVFDDLGLATDPEYAAGDGPLSSVLNLLRPTPASTEERIFDKFLASVSVNREGLTYVIDVAVKSSDPAKAARIANAIVEHYIASTGSQQSQATAYVTETLNAKITALQNDVTAADRAVADFKQKNGIFDETTGGTLQSQIDTLSGQVLGAQDALSQAQSRYDQALAAGTSPQALLRLADVSSSPAIEGLRTDYNQRSADLASAQATLGPKHPTVIQAKAQLSKVEGLLSREASRISKQLKADRDLGKSNLDKLEASLAALRQKSSQSSVAQVELRQLQGKADAAHAVLADFLQRSQETSQIEGLQNSQVHVISQAAAPLEPTWPRSVLLFPVSTALGFMLGCGVALMLGPRGASFAAVPVSFPRQPTPPEPPKPTRSEPAAPPVSAARRFASLDTARREVFSGKDTSLTILIQQMLSEVLMALPPHAPPYVLAFSSVRDPELAATGAALTAIGLERIGAKAVMAGPAGDRSEVTDQSFILVTADHPLAAEADLQILVLRPEEKQVRPVGAKGITLTIPAALIWPGRAANSDTASSLKAV